MLSCLLDYAQLTSALGYFPQLSLFALPFSALFEFPNSDGREREIRQSKREHPKARSSEGFLYFFSSSLFSFFHYCRVSGLLSPFSMISPQISFS